MSFGGHVADMINRWKYNYSLKKDIRDKYNVFMSPYLGVVSKPKKKRKQLTKIEIENHRQTIKEELKLEKQKTILASLIVILFLGIIIVVLYKKFYT